MELTQPDRSLDPRVVTLWRVQGLIRFGIFWLPLAGVGGAFLAGVTAPLLAWSLAGLVVLFNGFMALVWPALEYKAFRFAVRPEDLLVQHGVVFRQWSSIPHSRIQHVDTRQGPLERMLGLARLQVFTAAGMSADGSLPGLAEEQADALRDELSRRGGDDGV